VWLDASYVGWSTIHQCIDQFLRLILNLHAANTLILIDTVVDRFLLSSSTFSDNNARINGLFEDPPVELDPCIAHQLRRSEHA
jgi:hypothetical protein